MNEEYTPSRKEAMPTRREFMKAGICGLLATAGIGTSVYGSVQERKTDKIIASLNPQNYSEHKQGEENTRELLEDKKKSENRATWTGVAISMPGFAGIVYTVEDYCKRLNRDKGQLQTRLKEASREAS